MFHLALIFWDSSLYQLFPFVPLYFIVWILIHSVAFINSAIDGQLCCFQFFTVTNKAVSTHVEAYIYMYFSLSWIIPRSWITNSHCRCMFNIFLKILFIYFQREGKRKEKEKERNITEQEKCQLVASHMPPARDLACNPGTCPDWDSNLRPFGSQARAQSTEPH